MDSFNEFFRHATGNVPYAYQGRLAASESFPEILNVPTGSGKTAAVLLSWLWRRRYHSKPDLRLATPRRLVYCLPMRVLVEQTRDNIQKFLQALSLDAEVGVYVLMGGEVNEEWTFMPEDEAVIIGTQDMLLSRALNRGYAMSRFRWPIPFGLLNNDVLWVMDEIQLMGAGVPTTAQLEAFRQQYGTFGPNHTLWMSATIQPEWLKTVDHPAPNNEEIFSLSRDEEKDPGICKRLQANKILQQLPLRASVASKGYPTEIARAIIAAHHSGTQTLIIINTVDRAQRIYEALQIAIGKLSVERSPAVLLIHSRFRPPERQDKLAKLFEPVKPEGPGRIVVSTQVVEAGVDITSALLITELAPWSSLIQRFGRCNRYGELSEAGVMWINIPDNSSAPYTAQELGEARKLLESMEGKSAAPADLPEVSSVVGNYHVLRRKDLLELFDTAPDLSGNDVDISRFVRETGDINVFVCWWDLPKGEAPPATHPRPVKEELCPAPIGQLREHLIQAKRTAWIWDHLDRRWRRLNPGELFPGQIVVVQADQGGYDEEIGWFPSSKAAVGPIQTEVSIPDEGSGDDQNSFTGVWQTLGEHSRQTAYEMEKILDSLNEPASVLCKDELILAALWHDMGKAHPVFQQTLLDGLNEQERHEKAGDLWAKSPHTPSQHHTHARPHFRHELASLLALMHNNGTQDFSDLALYLIASHHGRVRLSIRSLPGSDGHVRGQNTPKMILGIEDGDELPAVKLTDGRALPPTRLSLLPAQIGDNPDGPSWLFKTLALRDRLGPFRLAYLEALLRAADVRASIAAKEGF